MDCSPPGSFVHGILQVRILEWVVMPSSRGSSWPKDQTHISYVSCIGRWVFYHYHHPGSPKVSLQSSLHFNASWDALICPYWMLYNHMMSNQWRWIAVALIMGDMVPHRLPKPWTCSPLPGCDVQARAPGEHGHRREVMWNQGEILLNEKLIPEISGLDANESWMGLPLDFLLNFNHVAFYSEFNSWVSS